MLTFIMFVDIDRDNRGQNDLNRVRALKKFRNKLKFERKSASNYSFNED